MAEPALDCRCTNAGVKARDPERHAAWHALVLEQGGPAGVVGDRELRVLRGTYTPPAVPQEQRARERGKRAGGSMRRPQPD